MKIIYLTWGETPRSYGVFSSQVLSQFISTKKAMPSDSFYFVSAVPIVHSGLVREKWAYSSELRKVRNKLEDIPFSWLPIYASQNFVNSSKRTFSFMHYGAVQHLRNKFVKLQPDIVHCRSYHAAWAALTVRKKHNLGYKIVFDGRGLWPEEVALKKNYSKTNKNYLFLKRIEQELLEECDVSISVSDTMYKHYKNLGSKRGECVYLSSSIKKLAPKEIKSKNTNKVHFCYVGALSEDTWHKPTQLVDLFRHLRTIIENLHLTIVTTSDHNKIKKYFQEVPTNKLTFTSTKSIDELKVVFKKCDIGLLAYREVTSFAENLIGETMLGTKTVEYLAAGLPVIANKKCGGAAELIRINCLGLSYNPETFESLTRNSIENLLNIRIREKCVSFAKENFDYKVNANQYAEIYKSLM